MIQKLPKIWRIICVLVVLTMAFTQTGVVFAEETPPPEETEVSTEAPGGEEEPTEEVTPEPEETEETGEPTEEATPEPPVIMGDLELGGIVGDLELQLQPVLEPLEGMGEEGSQGPGEEKMTEIDTMKSMEGEETSEEEESFNDLLEMIISGLMGEDGEIQGLLPESGQDLLGMLSDELTAAGVSPDDPNFESNLDELVALLSEKGLTLFDGDGLTVPLVSQVAEEVLTDADPMGCPEGVTPIWLGGTGEGCTASYTSIQAAIDDEMVQDGWTIYIQPGVFTEQVEVTKSVRLKGQMGTVLRTPETVSKFFGMHEYYLIGVHEHVKSIIEDMVIDGNNWMSDTGRLSGISFYQSTGGVFRSEIKNFWGGTGITTFNSKDITIEENDIHDNLQGVEMVSSARINVSDNKIHDNGVGVGSYISALVNVSDNIVENNMIGIKSQSSAGVNITGNMVEGNGMGVKLHDSADVLVQENQIIGNHVGVSNNFGLFNTIDSNVIEENDVGVVNVLSIATDITNNKITDNNIGVANALTLFTTINGNRIADNDVGLVNVVSVGTHVHFNEIEDNDIGVINANLIFPVHGEYNWWGCNEGPGAPGCNGIYDILAANFRYKPWLTDFDFDGVYTMFDNCPYTYNPDQLDSDNNGVGDACEPKTGIWTGRVVHFSGVLIPVTGANVVQIKCGGTTTLKLPDGSIAMVDNLCGYSVNLSDTTAHLLPTAMSPLGDPKYMNLQFLQPAVPSTARFSYSFAIPPALQGRNFKVIYWDDISGVWTTIPPRLLINGEVVAMPLYRDRPDKRVVLEGVYLGEDEMIHFTTNFPGVFVLVLDN